MRQLFQVGDKTNIFGSTDCEDCGACCVYFSVLDDDGTVFKPEGEICEHLEYDSATRKSRCGIYETPDRPLNCREFDCTANSIVFLFDYHSAWTDLQDFAERMPKLMKKPRSSE